MSPRSASQRAAQEVHDQEVHDQAVLDQEMAVAEHRGAERVRAQVRDVIADRRRVVRLGDQQIEVVEVSAIAEVVSTET